MCAFKDSHYHLVIEPDSDDLIISFSSRGQMNYSLQRYFAKCKLNQMYIVDFDGVSWYQNGTNGGGDDIFKLANRIRKICYEHNFKNIYCIGASMGGYAALAIGSLINATKVIAISPQIKLNDGYPYTPDISKDIYLRDISNLIEASKGTQFLICASSELLDIYHVSLVSTFSNVQISILDCEHNIFAYLKSYNFLQDFLDSIYKINSLEEIGIPTINIDYEKISCDLNDALSSFYKKDFQCSIKLLRRIVLLNPHWINVKVHLANCYFLNRDYKQALPLLLECKQYRLLSASIFRQILFIMSLYSHDTFSFQCHLNDYVIASKVREGDDNIVDILTNLADFATDNSNFKLTVMLRKILIDDYNIDTPENYYQLARGYQSINNFATAKAFYKKVILLKDSIVKNTWMIERSAFHIQTMDND